MPDPFQSYGYVVNTYPTPATDTVRGRTVTTNVPASADRNFTLSGVEYEVRYLALSAAHELGGRLRLSAGAVSYGRDGHGLRTEFTTGFFYLHSGQASASGRVLDLAPIQFALGSSPAAIDGAEDSAPFRALVNRHRQCGRPSLVLGGFLFHCVERAAICIEH